MLAHITDEELQERFTQDVTELQASGATVELVFTPASAWLIIGQLQLALRHPHNTGPAADKAREVITALASIAATTPVTKELLRRGFDAEYDVEGDPFV